MAWSFPLAFTGDEGAEEIKSFEDNEKRREEFLNALHKARNGLQALLEVRKLPEVEEPDRTIEERRRGRDAAAYPIFCDKFWQGLIEEKDKVGVFVSSNVLRQAGAAITENLSCEQTVEDLASELYLFSPLKALSQFAHIFVAVDTSRLIHLANRLGRTSRRISGTLYFTPVREDDKEGCVTAEPLKLLLSDGLDDSIKQGICNAMELVGGKGAVDAVSAAIPDFVLAEPLPEEPRSTKRWNILDETLENAPVHRINIAVAIVKAGLENVLNKTWEKPTVGTTCKTEDQKAKAKWQEELWRTLTRVETWNPRDRAPDYVTLQKTDRPAMPPRARPDLPPVEGDHECGFDLSIPILKVNHLLAAERDQIEDLQSITTLLRTYIREKSRHEEPISIAVFAPPGAGKSWAIKEIAESLGYKDGIVEFNVAQFRHQQDLIDALVKVKSASDKVKAESDKVKAESDEHEEEGDKVRPPLVFFDEFDCALKNEQLGWLKYFLAPMQDGVFYKYSDDGKLPGSPKHAQTPGDEAAPAGEEKKDDIFTKIGRAIFVFAGGIYPSYEKFDPRIEPPGEAYEVTDEYKKRVKEFIDRKGPDFISRLRGHMNIPEANAAPGQAKHFIRRAVQLRGLLHKLQYIKRVKNSAGNLLIEEALIGEPVIYAFLTVDRYQHGVRSMEAILRMCSCAGDAPIDIPSLPPRSQLNMHVDSREFFIRLYRGRSRMEASDRRTGAAEISKNRD